MTDFTKGHLSELALEMWAAREADTHDLEELESHIQACPACRAKATEWRGLFLALASLKDVEPSNSFEDKVMERVRIPSPQVAGVPAWVAKVAQRAPRIAAGVVGLWTLMIVGAAAWLQKTVDVPPAALLAQFLNSAKELLLAGAIEVATFLQLSGFIDWLNEVTETVPGLGVAGAVALMTALSGLAIWTLYRVTRDELPRVDAHA